MLGRQKVVQHTVQAAMLAGGALALGQDAASQARMRLLDSISGDSLMAIQMALPELARRGLTPDGYKITVWSTGAATTVMFEQTLARSGQIPDDVVRKPSLQVVLPAMRPPLPSTSPTR
jgi:hypothetical protein